MTRHLVAAIGAPVVALALLGGCAPAPAECAPDPTDTAAPWVEVEDLDDVDGDAPDACVLVDGQWIPADADEDVDGVHVGKPKTTAKTTKATKTKSQATVTRAKTTRKS